MVSSLLVAGYWLVTGGTDPLAFYVDSYPEGAYEIRFDPYPGSDENIGGTSSQRLSFKIAAPSEDIERFYHQAFEGKGWIVCSIFNEECAYVDYASCALNQNGFEPLAGYYYPDKLAIEGEEYFGYPNAVLRIKSVRTTTETVSLIELYQTRSSINSSCPYP